MYTASLACSVRFPTSYMLCEFHSVITLKNVNWKSFIIFINSRQVNLKQLIYIINIVSFTYFLIYRLSKRLIAASLQSYLSIDVQYEVRSSKLNTIMRKLFTFQREITQQVSWMDWIWDKKSQCNVLSSLYMNEATEQHTNQQNSLLSSKEKLKWRVLSGFFFAARCVLCYSLGSFAYRVLRQFARQNQPDCSLNLAGTESRLFVVWSQLGRFRRYPLEDIVYERIHDIHSFNRNANVRVYLLKLCVWSRNFSVNRYLLENFCYLLCNRIEIHEISLAVSHQAY